MLISKDGRNYRDAVIAMAKAQSWQSFGSMRLKVEIEAWMPDRRKRDLDNLFKSVLDCLTKSGVWDDDSQVDDLRIIRAPHVGGMLKIRITSLSTSV